MDITNLQHFVKVYVKISNKIQPIDDRFHIKWEQNLIKEITCREFVFYTLTVKQAIEKIAYMQSLHHQDYFSQINIELAE